MKVVSSSSRAIPGRINATYGGPPTVMILMTVLTVGARGDDYAAYEAVIPDTSLRDDHEEIRERLKEWVARNGHKLRYEEAIRIFALKGKEYRI